MPRPVKYRKVCHFPPIVEFRPINSDKVLEPVILCIEEYEAIRLMDKEGFSQEQCSNYMQIARTTVQRIYEIARQKIATALVEGRPIRIEGGDYVICSGHSLDCGHDACLKYQYRQMFHNKGDNIMRIAVTYENEEIFQHFGHTQQFKVYDVENGAIVSSQVVDTNGSGHGALAGILAALNADVLICGGIGGGAQMALADADIKLFGGVSGNADAAVEAFLAGNLAYNPNVQCNHHDHNHGEGHTCGDHGCGNHCGSNH